MERERSCPLRDLGTKVNRSRPAYQNIIYSNSKHTRCKRALPPVSLKKGHRVRKKLETPPNSWRDITADGDNELSNYHWYSTHYAKTYITQHKYPKLNNWVQRCVEIMVRERLYQAPITAYKLSASFFLEQRFVDLFCDDGIIVHLKEILA